MVKASFALIPIAGEVVLQEEQLAKPEAHEVLLKARYSSVSQGTETTLINGHILPLPQRLGYSMVAQVIEVGDAVEKVKPGDYVVTSGAHANYQMAMEPAVTKIPSDIDLEQAAFFNLSQTALYAMRRAHLSLGDTCLVLGQGLVGLLTAMFAKIGGASPLVVTDIDANRLALSKTVGVDLAIDAAEQRQELIEIAAALPNGGFDTVFEATGLQAPLKDAVDLAGERARIIMMSPPHGDEMPNISHTLFLKGASLTGCYINSKPFTLHRRDLTITEHWPPKATEKLVEYQGVDSWSGEADIALIMRLLSSSRMDIRPLITHRFAWQELPALYKRVVSGDSSMLGVVIDWNT
jgi:2-desacetyl-2-hydroxyethyl bacteriochlorophyllide A dehydrogenase